MPASPAPPALSGVLETVLYVEDLPRAERFYVEVLGFRKLSAEPGRSLFLRAGASVFLLFRAGETLRPGALPPHGARGPGHACFQVPESAYGSWKAYLPSRNVPVLQEQTWPGGGRSFYFHDPDGNLLEVADRDLWPK
ncbi:MAG TPA: VOC family protein [Candidatus Polarisedimenticolaceae bacterium]|nr:VOC family protein [Candidatus Polarisedimenticolaceae bacterium]